ncbi:MAG TPA: 16S rRNA (guanine(527)-N(7))-methyltransferase RsmG [Candidatus Nitrosotalea sp.]|nr:16S rRNA (guanine(527)-N(7))-methyltransferase RsmG [Candidatus Nitrosotalea sp.]
MPELEGAFQALLEPGGLESALRGALARYGALVLEENRRFNLTGAKTPEELAGHLLDSLTVVPYVRGPYVDVGSGAGLPAIPVAIAAAIEVTLIEATAKKARFLESALERLGIRGRVVAARAEEAGRRPDLRDRFKSGTARAIATAPTVAELLLPFLEPGGLGIVQRGELPPEERTALEDASLMLGARLEQEVPLEGHRRIVLLRKLGETPERFPRRAGIPAKRPLCL